MTSIHASLSYLQWRDLLRDVVAETHYSSRDGKVKFRRSLWLDETRTSAKRRRMQIWPVQRCLLSPVTGITLATVTTVISVSTSDPDWASEVGATARDLTNAGAVLESFA